MTRQYRCVTVVRYNSTWNSEPTSYERTYEQLYACENASVAAKQFINFLRNHCGLREAGINNVDVYVVKTNEKVDKGLLK